MAPVAYLRIKQWHLEEKAEFTPPLSSPVGASSTSSPPVPHMENIVTLVDTALAAGACGAAIAASVIEEATTTAITQQGGDAVKAPSEGEDVKIYSDTGIISICGLTARLGRG